MREREKERERWRERCRWVAAVTPALRRLKVRLLSKFHADFSWMRMNFIPPAPLAVGVGFVLTPHCWSHTRIVAPVVQFVI